MNLRALDQIVLVHQDEAQALRDAINFYHRLLAFHSGERQLHLSEVMSIRATLRVHDKMVKLLATTWPRTKKKILKPRRCRLEFDELLQVNWLYLTGELFAAEISYRVAFDTVCGKINQRAQNLNSHFQL
jgi:hypothetical protein